VLWNLRPHHGDKLSKKNKINKIKKIKKNQNLIHTKFQSQIRNHKKLMSCNKYLSSEFDGFFQKNNVELSQAFFFFLSKWPNFVLEKC